MDLQTDRERLQSAWRALAGDSHIPGWRTIPFEVEGPCRVLAGRHFPGNEEAILVVFDSGRMPPDNHIPRGRGFHIEEVKYDFSEAKQLCLSLSRSSTGNLEMFSRIAEDIIGMFRGYEDVSEDMLLQLFLRRITAWQEFMERERDDVLGREAEVGLFGELVILKSVLNHSVSPTAALESWKGPLDGLHDFLVGTGAIEVKSTVAANGFLANVGSLEQLDHSLVGPLFLAGVRLSLGSSGQTLTEKITEVREILSGHPESLGLFDCLVLRAGFLWAFSDSYKQRFSHVNSVFMRVDEGFPSLTHGNVANAITRARYQIDLDLVGGQDVGVSRTFGDLGIT